uniref:Uncharacterized protein n=1 Tax=Podarcis muralis TaxID=64176 RepID=A0A670JB68_PODMU
MNECQGQMFADLLIYALSPMGSRSVVARVFSSAHAVMIRHGLGHLSRSSKSIAKFVQPHLIQKLAGLHRLSHCLLQKLNAPKQPLYKLKEKSIFLYDVLSYPTKTALTGVMCISYAALIYLVGSVICSPHPHHDSILSPRHLIYSGTLEVKWNPFRKPVRLPKHSETRARFPIGCRKLLQPIRSRVGCSGSKERSQTGTLTPRFALFGCQNIRLARRSRTKVRLY